MSITEIGFRLSRATRIAFEKGGIGLVDKPPQADSQRGVTAIVPIGNGIKVSSEMYVAAADKIIAGKLKIFALNDFQHGPDISWNRDPMTGTYAPLKFGKTLDYRDPTIVGDIKYLWEPNRHLHLVTVAQAFRLTEEKKYIEFIIRSIRSWMDQCPYPLGPNWCSSLELAIRLINWTLVWRIVGGERIFRDHDDGKCFIDNWLQSIYQHCHFIATHFSGYSSAGNHLIGEAAGLYCAASLWNYWPSCDGWRDKAKTILVEQAYQQVTEDGVTKEQAIAYQQFVLDFFLVSALLGDQLDDNFPAEYWECIYTMIRFLAAIMDVGHNMPMLGDADDGFVFNLLPDPKFCPYQSLIATGAALFKDPCLKYKAGDFDEKSYWMLGEQGFKSFTAVSENNASHPREFPAGGYYILGSDLDTCCEVRLMVDSGSLGLQPIAGHGHADALSLLLSIGGEDILVDVGTYAYHTKLKMRDYFRGTSAHNTARIDGQNQSISGGAFMWIKHARARCLSWKPGHEEDKIIAEHDGYTRLADPVIHMRQVVYNKPKKRILITDTIKSGTHHYVELFWHVSERCTVYLVEREVHIKSTKAEVIVTCLDDSADVRVVRGDSETPLGWISRSFDVLEPTTTVVFKLKTQKNQSIDTLMDIRINKKCDS